jgi:hypothetical protein
MKEQVEWLGQNLDWKSTRITIMTMKMHVYGFSHSNCLDLTSRHLNYIWLERKYEKWTSLTNIQGKVNQILVLRGLSGLCPNLEEPLPKLGGSKVDFALWLIK